MTLTQTQFEVANREPSTDGAVTRVLLTQAGVKADDQVFCEPGEVTLYFKSTAPVLAAYTIGAKARVEIVA